MAIYYVDFENGNDANNGTTFALRKKTLNSMAAINPNFNDTIRVMASPYPTDTGINATWAGQKMQATKTVTNASVTTPIVCTCAAHGYANGDTVYIQNITNNPNANGYWEIANVTTNTFELVGSVGTGTPLAGGAARLRNSCRLLLSAPLVANIASHRQAGEIGGRTPWVASPNVTTSLNTTSFKAGNASDFISIAAGFTTGLAAYTQTGLLDLSAYQQISFWIAPSTVTPTANQLSLILCSDTACTVVVNTINIPLIPGATGTWHPITVDNGGPLGSNIQSIGLRVNNDLGVQGVTLNNIIACKAPSAPDSLDLNSLVGKNVAGESWYGIQSIIGTRVVLDLAPATTPLGTFLPGYIGTSETVPFWKREPIPFATQFIGNGSGFEISCGWDRTDMSTRDGETWIDGVMGTPTGFNGGNRIGVTVSRLGVVRCNTGITANGSGSGQSYVDCHANNCATAGIALSGNGAAAINNIPRADSITNCFTCMNSGSGTSVTNWANIVNGLVANSNAQNGLGLTCGNSRFTGNITTRNNGGVGISMLGTSGGVGSYNQIFANINSSDNTQHGIYSNPSSNNVFSGTITVNNNAYGIPTGASSQNNIFTGPVTANQNNTAAFSSASSDVYFDSFSASGNVNTYLPNGGSGGRIFVDRFDGVAGDKRMYQDWALWQYVNTDGYTALGCWQCVISNSNRSALYPTMMPIRRIPVVAGGLCTASVWCKRAGVGCTCGIEVRGGQIAGVPNDVLSEITSGSGAWVQRTITFTPTQSGYIDLDLYAYYISAFVNLCFDDFTFSQVGGVTITSDLSTTRLGEIVLTPSGGGSPAVYSPFESRAIR